MALNIADRVKESSTSTGTGTLTLGGAVSGFQSFATIGNGNQCYYTIVHNSLDEWEVGVGTYTVSGTTLSRDTVLDSSSGGAKVSFSVGNKEVFVTYPADRSVSQADIGTEPNEIPLNQYLGNLAYQDAENIAGDVGVGGDLDVTGTSTLTGAATLIANPIFSGGTANGVVFLNGSKVATSGSALTYNGTSLSLNRGSAGVIADFTDGVAQTFRIGTTASYAYIDNPSAGALGFQLVNVEQMRLTTTGLGIGTSTPSGKFHIVGSTYDYLIGFGANEDNYYSCGSSGVHIFRNAATETARIDSSGHLIVPAGITLGTAAGTYNAANTLDDYEEGTWTPVLSGFTTAGTYELVNVAAKYIKIGNKVTVTLSVGTGASITGGGTGSLMLTGLPFAKGSSHNAYAVVASANLNYTAGGTFFVTFGTNASTSNAFFALSVSNGAYTYQDVSLLGTSKFIGFTFTYFTD